MKPLGKVFLAQRNKKREIVDNELAKRIQMTGADSKRDLSDGDRLFDDGDALVSLAQRSFNKAAREAVAENESLGILTHGTINGELVVRRPARVTKVSTKR